MEREKLIIIRGGGDIATGTICRLHCCGFRLLVLETEAPLAIRRRVAVCEAVYDGQAEVEGVVAERIAHPEQMHGCWDRGQVPVLVDPAGTCIAALRPACLIDAILAKRNLGTSRAMAPLTIGLGPGFVAGEDVHVVIETARGHHLGRLITSGPALADTGIPGEVAGYGRERVVRAPGDGSLAIIRDIGTAVLRGEPICTVAERTVVAPIDGLIRGMLRGGSWVRARMKIADIDPRTDEPENCTTISDKARCIAGGVLEAVISHLHHSGNRPQSNSMASAEP